MSTEAEPEASAEPSESPRPARKSHFVDLSPLKISPAFARLWIGSGISGIGAQLTIVAVGLQIYDMTESTLAVALVGGIALLPMIVAGLWGGMLADAFDRRKVLILSSLVGWVSTLSLVVLSAVDAGLAADGVRAPVWPFYIVTTVNSIASTIRGATHMSVYPRILPAAYVSRASALGGISGGIQLTAGPALAGVLVALIGLPLTFAVDVVLFTFGFLGILGLPKMPPLSHTARPGLESLRDGFAFLKNAPNIRAGFLIDVIAMSFGRPFVLLPAVGAAVIGGGPVTVGVLTAAAAVGTFLTGLFSGPVGRIHRYGVAIGRSVIVYGACVAAFGLVLLVMQSGAFGPVGPSWGQVNVVALVLAAIALAGTGASDEVSAIFRSTMLLTAAPDEMRGRLQGVFMVVVTGGPRIGDLYAGILASIATLWFPPLLGGLVIMVAVGVILRVLTSFREYDARDPRP
ncbi:MFS transporter [Agromyces protaetiae]|uniref:MFS transporter n=1 Tax=Agromyces protaetiae TaxID=2509455 RepID=A0A4P6FEE9_9MICO|nr:MFS transporter [Agromyces protaetiae]QAY73383.1 MFS transporter [Agromyces protaetiae]